MPCSHSRFVQSGVGRGVLVVVDQRKRGSRVGGEYLLNVQCSAVHAVVAGKNKGIGL